MARGRSKNAENGKKTEMEQTSVSLNYGKFSQSTFSANICVFTQ